MTERTALHAMEALDKDRWTTQRSVMEVINIVRDYIPEACIREASDKLFDAFFINGIELTSNTMRKEYEAWKKLELNSMLLKPNIEVKP